MNQNSQTASNGNRASPLLILVMVGAGILVGTVVTVAISSSFRLFDPDVAARGPLVRRDNAIYPVPLSPEERQKRLKKDFDHLQDQWTRLRSYKDRLESYVKNEKLLGTGISATDDQVAVIEEVLDRVTAHTRELKVERDAAYMAWQDAVKE